MEWNGCSVERQGYLHSLWLLQNINLFSIKLPAAAFSTVTVWCVSDLRIIPSPTLQTYQVFVTTSKIKVPHNSVCALSEHSVCAEKLNLGVR